VSRCANEVKRTFRSNSAFLVIWASLCGHHFPSPCVRAVFLQPSLTLPPPLPHVRGFPALRVSMGESDFHRPHQLPSEWFFRSAYSARMRTKTAVDLPGS